MEEYKPKFPLRRRGEIVSNAVLKKIEGKTDTRMQMNNIASEILANAVQTRAQLISQIIDGGGKDLNTSCGYPSSIEATDYENFYSREGVAARVVDVWPEESWSIPPLVYEVEDPNKVTEFEKVWTEVSEEQNLLSILARADTLSGIGRFGVLLLGIDDGEDLEVPVDGVSLKGNERIGGDKVNRSLLYIRPFQESVVEITETEKDVSNPRFGLPVMYNIFFIDGANSFSKKVHWHRVIHLADKREMSDTFGTPRMQKSYNRLLDVRKVLGGSGEMFWKGGFPGYSFEADNDAELDLTSLRSEMQNYFLGLQRSLAMQGGKIKSLAPQVADPKSHLECQMNAIAISEGIPKRILFGSEQGELASSQDTKTWNRRLKKRQEQYITPLVIRPFIDRLIALAVLPTVERYFVKWPDLDTQTDKEKADVARVWSEALAKFVAGDCDQVIPIEEFLTIFGNLPQEQVALIMERVKAVIKEEDDLGAEDIEEEDEDE